MLEEPIYPEDFNQNLVNWDKIIKYFEHKELKINDIYSKEEIEDLNDFGEYKH